MSHQIPDPHRPLDTPVSDYDHDAEDREVRERRKAEIARGEA